MGNLTWIKSDWRGLVDRDIHKLAWINCTILAINSLDKGTFASFSLLLELLGKYLKCCKN